MWDVIGHLLIYAYGAWRYRSYAVVVTWLICVIGWAGVAVMPDTYRSSALVHVDTASVLQPLLQGLTVETDVAGAVDLMQKTLLSRPNIERVARATDLDLTAKTSSDMERLIQSLTERLQLQRRGKDLFQIVFEDNNPQVAHRVVQEFLSIFVDANLGQNRKDLEAARTFIDGQIKQYEKKLAEAEQNIVDFKRKNFGQLSGPNNQFGSIDAIQRNVSDLEANLREAKSRRATLQKELKAIPEFFPSTGGAGQGPPTDTTVQLLEVQKRLEDLRSRYTEKHPDVIAAKRRLDALLEQQRKELEAGPAKPDQAGPDAAQSEATGVLNPVYEQVKVQLVQVEAEIAGLADRVTQGRAELADARKAANRAPELDAELARLERDYNVLMSSYQRLLASRETEQMSRARDVQADKVRFSIVEPPTVPAAPSGPPRLIFLALVLAVSLGSGAGFATLLAISSDSISSVVELRAVVSAPVFGSVSVADIADRDLWSRTKPVIFWTALVMLFATFAAIWFVEMRVGLNELVMDVVQNQGLPDWLRRLPFP
jgi:polysaccharide chain length determinant protein (PEP-CTERM system associated)